MAQSPKNPSKALKAQVGERRRSLALLRQVRAEDRWQGYLAAAARRAIGRERSKTEQSLVPTLARGKWVGRSLLLARSGLWVSGIETGLGLDPTETCSLITYVRAGPSGGAQPRALFDQTWYLKARPDLVGSQWAPLLHYLVIGDQEGTSPHPLFDLRHYKSAHAVSIAASGLSALEHFFHMGAASGFDPHPLFDLRHYVGQSDDLAQTGENPLLHYLRKGHLEGLDPHPLFANDWYRTRHMGEARSAPLVHYVTQGARRGADPHPLFDQAHYLRHRDGASGAETPLAHFMGQGRRDRRSPHPGFDPVFYASQHNLASESEIDPFFHYLTRGTFEGAWPSAEFDEVVYAARNADLVDRAWSGLEHWVRSSSPLPQTSGEAGGAGQGAEALFEQMRTSARQRDAQAYDTATYEHLSQERRQKRADHIGALKLKPLEMIKVAASGINRAAAALGLPDPGTSPRVSIIIPAYNNLTYSLECLTSLVRGGDLAGVEVIVIDDASADDTVKVLSGVANLTLIANGENLGFIRTCNKAAAVARGEILVFLNNDVQVRPGWLSALIEALDEEPQAGAAAPKMLFPDGRLQEAGGRIGLDGRSEMIGLFDDPSLARYNVRREVDYASGACLAVRRADFMALKGFDEHFVPAYCEDADLCFRLRERGLRIIYEPRSEIVHHLSITANSIDQDYKIRLATRNQQRFVERWSQQLEDLNRVRTIAFHLPQFHAIPENDRWWGAGFTEWTNVTRALPNYRGHYQPHLPADLGFYDLSDPRALRRQTDLAKAYGIGGFCHYFYWFSGGRRVLEKPLDHLLAPDAPDFPFCLCWANENWTRTWDGQERDVLLSQTYEDGDAEALMAAMGPWLTSPNYIRVSGRPLVVIYRPGLLPDALAWTQRIRTWCRDNGIGEIYLAFVENFENALTYPDPKASGFDASIEFPPAGMSSAVPPPGPLFNAQFEGVVSDYREVVRRYLAEPTPAHTRFRGAMPSWDNSARRQDVPYIFQNASPGGFQAWLEALFEETRRQNFGDERIVFINAWNEWAEGAHLEPDIRFGHGWLEAVRNAAEAGYLDRP